MEAIEGAEENNFAAEAPRRRASLIKGELTLARELRLARAVPPRKFALRLGASAASCSLQPPNLHNVARRACQRRCPRLCRPCRP